MSTIHFSRLEEIEVMGKKSSRPYVETRKCIKSIYFAHQLRDAIRHVKYATD
jgi:hypothetical protein